MKSDSPSDGVEPKNEEPVTHVSGLDQKNLVVRAGLEPATYGL